MEWVVAEKWEVAGWVALRWVASEWVVTEEWGECLAQGVEVQRRIHIQELPLKVAAAATC